MKSSSKLSVAATGKGSIVGNHKGGVSAGDRKPRWGTDRDRDRTSSPFKPQVKDVPSPAAVVSDAAAGTSARSPGGPLFPHRPTGSPFPPPDLAPPTPPPYGFNNLERRTIVLADGTVRSYFALPADYELRPQPPLPSFVGPPSPRRPGFGPRFSPEEFPYRRPGEEAPRSGGSHDYWSSLGLDGEPSGPSGTAIKRKVDEEDEFAWHRRHVLQYGNPDGNEHGGSSGGGGNYPLYPDDMRMRKQARIESEGGRPEREGLDDPRSLAPPKEMHQEDNTVPAAADVDPQALKRAFLKMVKLLNENAAQKKNYLADGHEGVLQCIVCGRASKDFTDVHELILHAYNYQNPDLLVDHLALHKALCVLMGWNYAKTPENTKSYQSLSADDAAANWEDLILFPPTVIIHNTTLSKRKDGRMEGMGNKEMDTKLKELGFGGGKSKSLYGKEGHLGITLVKFASTQAGLKEAERLAGFFEKDNHGRRGWSLVQASQLGDSEENNPALMKLDAKTGENKRIFYGYLATASDLDVVDFDTRKRAIIKSKKENDLI